MWERTMSIMIWDKKGEREQRILRFEREKLRENTEYCDLREKVEREQGY